MKIKLRYDYLMTDIIDKDKYLARKPRIFHSTDTLVIRIPLPTSTSTPVYEFDFVNVDIQKKIP